MGSAVSSSFARHNNNRISEEMSDSNDQGDSVEEDKFYDTNSDIKAGSDMEEFKRELSAKREQRREILDRLKSKKDSLEKALEQEKKSKIDLKEENRVLRDLLTKNNVEVPDILQYTEDYSEFAGIVKELKEELSLLKDNNNRLRTSLAESNVALQSAYSEIADLHEQNTESIKQINALKEVTSVSKTMLGLREQQLLDLKNKLNEIEQSLADREASMLSSDLRQEYERQLQNIRTLRGLYEERARLAEVTRQNLVRELEEQKSQNHQEIKKCADLTTQIQELENEIQSLNDTIKIKTEEVIASQKESSGLKTEMLAVNKLFSQILLGYKKKQDLDKLIHRLEENHGILTHLAENEIDSEAASALPKLLLELINQTDEEDSQNMSKENKITNENEVCSTKEVSEQIESEDSTGAAEEIVRNLPKVWRVLIELLSHQTTPEPEPTEKVTTCYKTVQTSSGPVQVPSVSQTYIRLKDLIIEKLALLKEVNRMKQLNNHLESRLEGQEQRLCLVTKELSKTWHVVGRLRRHHHQLHTHEKILKYELQQKRKLLNELKEELEYCREKWEQAREKNTQSEKDWKNLRTEFSNRKLKVGSPSLTNSAESGYSDERPSDSSDSNDESEYVAESSTRSRRKSKTSYEGIIDSSTDMNVAAEREDPVSDILDITDLSLDTQEGDDNPETSRSISLNCPKTNDETEDEAYDIVSDSCSNKIPIDQSGYNNIISKQNNQTNTNMASVSNEIIIDNENGCNICEICSTGTVNSAQLPESSLDVSTVDPKCILESVNIQQNEHLFKKDKILQNLEETTNGTEEKLSQAIDTCKDITNSNINDNILSNKSGSTSSTVDMEHHDHSPDKNDHILLQEIAKIDRIDTLQCQEHKLVENNKNKDQSSTSVIQNQCTVIDTQTNILQDYNRTGENEENIQDKNFKALSEKSTGLPSTSNLVNEVKIPEIDLNSILESIKQQNERLAKKDERLQNLENGCKAVVKTISSTLNTGDELAQKLDLLHEGHKMVTEDSDIEAEIAQNRTFSPDNEDSEPSTSSDLDHEVRFAEREKRLKRLEEQTKSLVNKVNDTTTKGVKINYKLEELHNIYGSETSRDGTPGDDVEETTEIIEDEHE